MVALKRRPVNLNNLIKLVKLKNNSLKTNELTFFKKCLNLKKNKNDRNGMIIPVSYNKKAMLGIISNIIGNKCKVNIINRSEHKFYKDRERYIEWNKKKYKVYLADDEKVIFLIDSKIIEIKIVGDIYWQIGDRKNLQTIRKWNQSDEADEPFLSKKDHIFDKKKGEFILDYVKISKEFDIERNKIHEIINFIHTDQSK